MKNADMPAMPSGKRFMPDFDNPLNDKTVRQDGLTKREYLAALSLNRIEIYGDYGDKEVARIAASQAVMTADALLAELERTQ